MTEEKDDLQQDATTEQQNQNATQDGNLFYGIKLDSASLQIIEEAEENDSYQFKLDNFDGPLDLLLHLIKVAKIDIKDIFVSKITEQYMKYMEDIDSIDVEKASMFISMAATLIEIKASKVLPVDDDLSDYQEELKQTERDIISDVEKRMLLSFPEKLKPMETLNLFYNEPVYDENDYKLVAKDLTLDKLLDAYKLVLEKIEYHSTDSKPKTITKERFTVADKVKEIASIIRTEQKVSFFSLFRSTFTRLEVINVFLAILEIVKKQVASAVQGEDSDIILEHNPEDKFDALKQNDEELIKDVEEYN